MGAKWRKQKELIARARRTKEKEKLKRKRLGAETVHQPAVIAFRLANKEILVSKRIAYTLISGVLRVRHRNKSILHCAADYLIFQEKKIGWTKWFEFRMRVCLARESELSDSNIHAEEKERGTFKRGSVSNG